MENTSNANSQTAVGLGSTASLGSFQFIETATLPELGRVYADGRIEITGTAEEIRKAYENTKNPQMRMLLEIARLKDALAPFADYGEKHGASNLCGTNGAYLSAEAWVEAHAAFHGLPNNRSQPQPPKT